MQNFTFLLFFFKKRFKFIIIEFLIYMQCNMIIRPHFSLTLPGPPQYVLLPISKRIDIPEAN